MGSDILNRAIDAVDEMIKVKSMQKKWRESFPGSALRSNMWDVLRNEIPYSITGGLLRFSTGTTINTKTIIQSKEMFTVPLRLCIGFLLSQRIANQNFIVELVSCDKAGTVDDLNKAGWVLTGATATSGTYRVRNVASTADLDASSTIATTASNGILEVELFSDEAYFHSRVLDSTNGRSNSAVRHRDIPDPNQLYKIRITVENLGTAPASSTNWDILYVLVNDYAELTAEVTAGRGNSVAGQGVYATVGGSVSVVSSTPANPTAHVLESAATTNATSVKTTAGSVMCIVASNLSASVRYLKMYNKASAPTVGTDIPIETIPLPANSTLVLDFGAHGSRFSTGIAFAITGAAPNTDTTAIGANEVKLHTSYL